MLKRAKDQLKTMAECPHSYAICKEAFLSHICGMMWLLDYSFEPHSFYTKHCGVHVKMTQESIDDSWAKSVIEDILAREVFSDSRLDMETGW